MKLLDEELCCGIVAISKLYDLNKMICESNEDLQRSAQALVNDRAFRQSVSQLRKNYSATRPILGSERPRGNQISLQLSKLKERFWELLPRRAFWQDISLLLEHGS
jgi:hypothetical protein